MVFEWDQTRAMLPINLNAVSLANGPDASPMDLVQYPNSSRFRNFQKPEDLDKAVADQNFENAAVLRDKIAKLKKKQIV